MKDITTEWEKEAHDIAQSVRCTSERELNFKSREDAKKRIINLLSTQRQQILEEIQANWQEYKTIVNDNLIEIVIRNAGVEGEMLRKAFVSAVLEDIVGKSVNKVLKRLDHSALSKMKEEKV